MSYAKMGKQLAKVMRNAVHKKICNGVGPEFDVYNCSLFNFGEWCPIFKKKIRHKLAESGEKVFLRCPECIKMTKFLNKKEEL